MNKTIFILLLVCFFNSCKEESSFSIKNNYKIEGIIDGIDDGTNAYLKTQEDGNLVVLKSTIIRNGKFEFKGKIDKPKVYGIFIDSIKGTIGLFMENDNITIEVNKDNLSSSIITGSKTNNDYLDFIVKSNQIISKMNILFPEFQKARAENDVIKLEEINNKMQIINDKNTAFILSYTRGNPNSYVSAVALQSILRIPSIHKDTIANIYSKFSDYVKKGDYSKEIEVYLNTPITLDSIQN